MKKHIKGSLNVGVHAFVRDKEFQARLIVQNKPIKWSWIDNYLSEIEIVPTLLNLDSIKDWRRRDPYQVRFNDRDYIAAWTWDKAIDSAQWRFDRLTEKLGINVDFRKAFLKREPRITFSEVHRLLKEAGVELTGVEG